MLIRFIFSFFLVFSNIEAGTLCRVKKIIGPPPAQGSSEEAQDFAILLNYQATRTVEQCEAAGRQESVSLESFFGGENGPLSPDEVKHFKLLFFKYMLKAGIPSTYAKLAYKRPRPYDANPAIVPCIEKETSYAYPSGHASVARTMAQVLSKKFPERAELFMQSAAEVAKNRMLGGVHHPTDIVAGIKLGDEFSKKLFTSQKFMQELDEL